LDDSDEIKGLVINYVEILQFTLNLRWRQPSKYDLSNTLLSTKITFDSELKSFTIPLHVISFITHAATKIQTNPYLTTYLGLYVMQGLLAALVPQRLHINENGTIYQMNATG